MYIALLILLMLLLLLGPDSLLMSLWQQLLYDGYQLELRLDGEHYLEHLFYILS